MSSILTSWIVQHMMRSRDFCYGNLELEIITRNVIIAERRGMLLVERVSESLIPRARLPFPDVSNVTLLTQCYANRLPEI